MQTSPQTPPRTSPRTPRRTRGRILVAAALGIVLTALVPVLNGTRTPASAAGTAPGSPGLASTWGPGEKSFLGTSRTTTSKVYFTGYRGIISEVFNPVADTVETVDLQFLVGDTAKTFVDEEKLQNYTVTQPNPRSMRWQTTTANPGHRWSITKNIFTDPGRDALIARVTLNATGGASLGDLDLYLLHNPAMDNSGAGDTSSTLTAGGRTLLVSSQGSRASALAVSRPWKTAGGTPMVSSGFVGTSDGWTDLLGAGPNGTADKTMSWAYDTAGATGNPGNTAQMGWVDLPTTGTSVSFDVVLGFGTTPAAAATTTNATLGSNLATLQSTYDSGWSGYTATLNTQGGTADDQYYLAAMALKSIQDKSNGAMIAGLGTPWGASNGDGNTGGYHLVWSRDLFKFANALLTAGDVTTAQQVTSYLFTVMRQTADCGAAEYNAPGCPQGYSRIGRFPQNSWVSGWQYWQGTQLDEQAMPIILAWRTYSLGPAATKTAVNALWPQIKTTADYLLATGPWTHQERWEEQSGYSPSTIAAEIAGLVAASEFAKLNGDTTAAASYLAAADRFQQRVDQWTFTTTGPWGDGRYYERINPAARGNTGVGPQRYNPVFGPDTAATIQDKNGGGARDQRREVDGGFLELVRMGVKRADDPSITATLPEYDALLKQTIAGKGDAWFRYNYDGYGEKNDGSAFDGTGRGRLWPIFTAERGMYEIARTGTGTAGVPYRTAVKNFSSPTGAIPEQVWNTSTTLSGDWVTTTPAGRTPGTATGSMSPLNWAMGEYLSLTASINAGNVVDILPAVCGRYHTCTVPTPAGQVAITVGATATTVPGQQVYVTGNQAALGNWNPDLAIPLDPATYPVWTNRVNLPASTAVQYKYLRKNDDGTITWENIAGGGNRSFTTPASGTATRTDTVAW
ncbi:MAG: glycoside hydrolase family 15 protein [Kineosporiaceae bacterium]